MAINSLQSFQSSSKADGLKFTKKDISALVTNATSLQTALSITGSGDLYTALVYCTASSGVYAARTKITVDGVVIFDFDSTGTSKLIYSSTSTKFGIGLAINGVSLLPFSTNFVMNNGIYIASNSIGGVSNYMSFPSPTTIVAATNNGLILTPPAPIHFNNSLLIEVVKDTQIAGFFEYLLAS